MADLRLAIVGLGKIAEDEHVPAIRATEGVELVAVASRNKRLAGVPHFSTLEALLGDGPEFDAVALCTPPQVRYAQAKAALAAGKHVLLEKPPATTLGQMAPLVEAASGFRRTLFAAWHSRYAPAVEPARALLSERRIRSVRIAWREDARAWHPGQKWLWEPGGFGVFDPGINALSILTRILPHSFYARGGTLSFPVNCATPIAASLEFVDVNDAPILAEFDFNQSGPPTWQIDMSLAGGEMTLSCGGSKLHLNGESIIDESTPAEYRAVYASFLDLIARGVSDVDLVPLAHVADAFMIARREFVAAFSGAET